MIKILKVDGKKIKSNITGKDYDIDMLISMNFDLNKLPEDIQKKINQIKKKRSSGGEVIYGKLKKETSNAYLFKILKDPALEGRELWFPKKVCMFIDGALGSLDGLSIPSWLYKNKVKELND